MSNPGVVVLDFLSESECSDEQNEPPSKRIRVRMPNVWIKKEVYFLREEPINAIGSDFKVDYTNTTKQCTKVTYYCGLHGKMCGVRRLLSYPNNSQEIVYFETESTTHSASTKSFLIELRTLIDALIKQGITTPLQIVQKMQVTTHQ